MTTTDQDRERCARTRASMRARLLAAFDPTGCWHGRLADSALSTATAVTALALADPGLHAPLIHAGLDWLAAHQNADGGWGDTPDSRSNINTTALAWAAFNHASADREVWSAASDRGGAWIRRTIGGIAHEEIVARILAFYGRDRTFSTPVLTMLALSGKLGPRARAFRRIPALPFELAATPPGLWHRLGLPVVSYAIPALVAIGQARHAHAPSRNPLLRVVRERLRARTLTVVRDMQPGSGGFLEAIPLTSFVCACLAALDRRDHPIVGDAVRFLTGQARPSGAWPIDTCLETWVTSLSVHALAAGNGATGLAPDQNRAIVAWLLAQQHRVEHPFTHTPPGGWSWMATDGAVPDADDTPGAMLALMRLAPDAPPVRAAIARAVDWLLGLQNRDGGMPTFCRGWGKLPFDRSASDITAHALRALRAASPLLDNARRARVETACVRLMRFLAATQRRDGAWLPLWFGNQQGPDDTNPCYGTARVIKGLAETGQGGAPACVAGVRWLLDARQADGGWSGGDCVASLEETGVAVEALATWLAGGGAGHTALATAARAAIGAGARTLCDLSGEGTVFPTAPIGLYFAKLWYDEQLYPLVFSLAALECAARV